MAAHAILSASGSHRWGLDYVGPPLSDDPRAWLDPANWTGCTGSVAMEADFPDTGSRFAAEGTAAHEIASQCLIEGVNAEHFRDSEVTVEPDDADHGETYVFTVDDEMIGAVQSYLDYCRSLPGEQFVEQRLDFSEWVPDGFGTGDHISVDDGQLYVTDLKYGKGLLVGAKANPQALLYALGATTAYGPEVDIVEVAIHQPRLSDTPSSWLVTRDDLMEWAENVVRPAALRVGTHPDEFNPGEKRCQFCKASGVCRALATQSVAAAAKGFDAVPSKVPDLVVEPGPARMSNEEVGALLPHVPLMKKWIDETLKYAKGELMVGNSVPGKKLVDGPNSRNWTDPDKAEKALKRELGADAAMPRKLLSPPQVEKLLGDDHRLLSDKFVTKTPGAPIMVDESDKRTAIEINPADGFGSVETTEPADTI